MNRRPDLGPRKDYQDCGVESVGDEKAVPQGRPQAEAAAAPEAQVLAVVGGVGVWAAAVVAAVGDLTEVSQASRGQGIQERLRGLGSQTVVSWAAVGEAVAAEGAYHIHSLALEEGGVGVRELVWSGRPTQQQCEARDYRTLKGEGVH